MVKKDISSMIEVEEQNTIVTGAQFPDFIFKVLGDLSREIGSVFLQKFDISSNLTVLNPGIFDRVGFGSE